MNMMKYVEILL